VDTKLSERASGMNKNGSWLPPNLMEDSLESPCTVCPNLITRLVAYDGSSLEEKLDKWADSSCDRMPARTDSSARSSANHSARSFVEQSGNGAHRVRLGTESTASLSRLIRWMYLCSSRWMLRPCYLPYP
jgi:hypothetical protein